MKKYSPILLILCTFIGIYIGISIKNKYEENKDKIVLDGDNVKVGETDLETVYNRATEMGGNKVNQVIAILNATYVEELSTDSIIELAMPVILSELDPHSSYIPAKDLQAVDEELSGSFSGIGIRFFIEEDTIRITDVVRGGPSERAGVLAGDKLVSIDDSTFVGSICKNDEAMKRLKGVRGSNVRIGVRRFGHDETLYFDITRDDISIESIEAYHLIDNRWGYIQLERFAENTYSEFISAVSILYAMGCKGYIIDVRGNGGGYLEIAFNIANQFLGRDELIVYTEGAHHPKEVWRANGMGALKDIPLVILTDETSASASEILAGAIQDNDRGTIIGRRTFGKGLVQQQIPLTDGSALRVTIARYHTPSGRCIQKPYVNGESEEYQLDLIERYERGEFFSQDSIHFNDSLAYKTRLGRTVYGGGGIMPDIFVSSDTSHVTSYYRQAVENGLIRQYTFKYSESNRPILSKYKTYEEMLNHLSKKDLVNDFVQFASKHSLKPRYLQIEKSQKLIERSIYSNIIYNILGMNESVRYNNTFDQTVLKAVEVLEKGESFPKAVDE